MQRSIRARFGVLFLSATTILAACGPSTSTGAPASSFPGGSPSLISPRPASSTTPGPTSTGSPPASPSGVPAPSTDQAAIYDAIEAQVVAIRGLKAVKVQRETIDEARLKQLTAADFAKDNPPVYVAANERLLKALGLLSSEQSLQSLYLELIGSQVAGFYRPDDKRLYVVSRSGAINGADKITFAHEYDHALQDANFPVFQEQKALLDQTDRAMARAAVFEGDATILMSLWAGPNLTPAELQEVIAAGSDPAANAILQRTPAILRESLLFPYNAGVAFLAPVQASGGWPGIDAIYKDLPLSTEQILHPDRYRAGEKPVAVTFPSSLAKDLGTGWSVPLEDTFGEFQMRAWLTESGVPAATAEAAAAGWGGDRLAVLEGPGGAWGVVMQTAWDTDGDAADFETTATTAIAKAAGRAAVLPGTGGKRRWVVVGSDDATLRTIAGALGLAG